MCSIFYLLYIHKIKIITNFYMYSFVFNSIYISLFNIKVFYLFLGNAVGEQYENTIAFRRLSRCPQHRHVLCRIVVQYCRFLRLLEVWRKYEGFHYTQSSTRPGAGTIRQSNDRCRDLPHLWTSVLRAHGDNLEECQAIFRLPATAWRILSPYCTGNLYRLCSDRDPQFGSVYLPRRSCMPVHVGSHVPVGDRTGNRLGTGERPRQVELAIMEEYCHHLFRRVGLPHRHVCQYPRDLGRQMRHRVRREERPIKVAREYRSSSDVCRAASTTYDSVLDVSRADDAMLSADRPSGPGWGFSRIPIPCPSCR